MLDEEVLLGSMTQGAPSAVDFLLLRFENVAHTLAPDRGKCL